MSDNIIFKTTVTLYLKEDLGKFIEEKKVKDLIKKYSEFVGYPINLYSEKTNEEEIIEGEDEGKTGEEKVTRSKMRARRRKRKRSQQSNINGILPRKIKHYGHINRMRLRWQAW
jgi:molecular chaperone HtpG